MLDRGRKRPRQADTEEYTPDPYVMLTTRCPSSVILSLDAFASPSWTNSVIPFPHVEEGGGPSRRNINHTSVIEQRCSLDSETFRPRTDMNTNNRPHPCFFHFRRWKVVSDFARREGVLLYRHVAVDSEGVDASSSGTGKGFISEKEVAMTWATELNTM